MTVEVKIVHAALKVHGEDQSHQPKIMIAVQMADEDVVDPVKVGLELHELHLGAFAAVNHKELVLYFNQLR